jgi:Diacylglycerol acyltransferase
MLNLTSYSIIGMFGIPLGPPKAVPLTVVVGKMIPIPKIEKPTKEDIAKYHELFIAAVEKLYEDNKSEYGLKDVPLKIK